MHGLFWGALEDVLSTCYVSWVKFTLYQLHCCYFDSELVKFAGQRKKQAGGGCVLQFHSFSM